MDLLVSPLVGLGTALIDALVFIFGWKVSSQNEFRRDIAAKRRDLRVQYLIEAYRRLEYVSNRPLTAETAPDFERAIADIRLFGSPDQVDLAQTFAADFSTNATAPLDSPLSDLRQRLRNEIEIEELPAQIKYLRFTFDRTEKQISKEIH